MDIDFRDKATQIRAGEELQVATLEPYLRSHFSDERGSLVIRQFPSGHSNLTYAVQLGEREMVLRRPPFGSKVKSAHDMSREFRVLAKLHPVYAPAPKVLLYCEDESILGTPFYLMEPIRGVILRRDPLLDFPFEPETARAVSESFIANLAHLHGLDYTAIGLGDFGKPVGYLERQVKGWIERYHGSKTEDHPEAEKLSLWMQQNLPPSPAVTLIHNDYKLDNIVLDPAKLSRIIGVLDWEMATIGDPLSDLGSTLGYWVDADDPGDLQQLRWGPTNHPGSLKRAELVERYAQLTGRHIDNMHFYLVFARFKLAVIIQQIFYRYRQGLTHDPRFAGMGEGVRVLLRAAWHAAQSEKI